MDQPVPVFAARGASIVGSARIEAARAAL